MKEMNLNLCVGFTVKDSVLGAQVAGMCHVEGTLTSTWI